MGDPGRQAAQQGKVLDALRLAFQALALGHFVLEGRRPGGDLLLQGRVEVVQRLVPRVQLGQGRGLRGDMPLLRGVQLPEFVLAAAGPQGHLDRTQQRDRGERALQHRDVAHRAQRLHALPQGLRGPGAAGQEHQGEIGPDGLPLQGRAQHVEGQRRQRFVGEEARRGRVHRRAQLLHVVAACVRIPAACKHATATAASRPVGVRISTGSSTPVRPVAGRQPPHGCPSVPVSCIRGEARQHPMKLR